MECKFLDSYTAELDGRQVEVWHCRKRDPFVLGDSKEVAMATCSSCRLADYTRPPAELAVEVERRNQELAALSSIVAAVNASIDLQTVLTTGVRKTVEILQVDAGWVALHDEGRFVMGAHTGLSDRFAASAHVRRADEGVVGLVTESQETVIVEDAVDHPAVTDDTRLEGLVTLVGVPLKAQGRLLAVMVLATRAPRSYSADDVYFASAAGAQLAAAVDRALLFRQQKVRMERERRLLEASETVNRSLDSTSLPATILTEATRLMDAQKAALLTVRHDSLVAEETFGLSEAYRQMFALPLTDSVSGKAIVQGQTLAVGDVDAEPLTDAYLVREGGYRAFMTAPLQSYKGTPGAISVYYDEPRPFSDDDLTVFRTFAVQAAIALDNRRLMHEKDELAVRDGLTGVFNRSYLELTLERTIKELRRSGEQASILFLDVDDLKSVNDGLGHQAGDRLLRELAAMLVHVCRESDIVARYGGDEFVVLMPGTDAEGARRVSDKIVATMRRRNEHQPGAPRLWASVGVHTAAGSDVETLLQEADRRMYAMKRARQRD